jgi:acyl dehydratase
VIDPSLAGKVFAPINHEVERTHIRKLAGVLNDANPLFHDPAAARAAGFVDLPAPPTLPIVFSLWANEPLLAELQNLGASLIQMLHGEQHYTYHAPICAGDVLTAQAALGSIIEKQAASGPLQLLTLITDFRNQRGEPVAEERLRVVLLNESLASAAPRPASISGSGNESPPDLGPLIDVPISQNRLVRYSGASGDYNPLHTDRDFARQAGLDDVIAHGMLVMGLAGRLLSDHFGPGKLRSFSARFRAMTRLNDIITCSGRLSEPGRGTLRARNQYGEIKLTGSFEAVG